MSVMEQELLLNREENSKGVMGKLMKIKVGSLPLPLYVVLAGIIFAAAVYGKLPADMIGGFAIIMALGMLLGDVGMKMPILKDIGGPAILSIFVPSIMVFYNLLNPTAMKSITAIMKTSNFLYLYISCLVVGSIFGMSRKILVQGFIKMFIPLTVGTLSSIGVGLLVGSFFGYDVHRTFFYIIMPIVSGGIGEGILPLSLGYAEILNQPSELFIPQLIPAAMLGNIVAIICAGFLKKFGEKNPAYNGNGLLVRTGEDKELLEEMNKEKKVEFPLMGAGLIMACTFYIFGGLANMVIPIPAAIIMILSAAIIKSLNIMPAKMEQGAYHMYRFISSSLTWPLLAGLGVLFVPWKDMIGAITPGYIAVCASVVLTMISSGFFVGKLMNMYSVEAALVTGCHSGLGGTGDVAILSASNRMELMPFAQISTRIGGAGMVVIGTILMKIFH